MDLEEAKKKVKITPEERAAVEKYINMWHAEMNSIIGFQARQYVSAASEGWSLPGMDKQIKGDAGEEVLSMIENAGMVYSAMLKSMYEYTPPYKLMRGTSNKEISRLSKGSVYNRMLSTSTDERTAKSFGRYGDAAFLRIIPGPDIPFINVDEFIGRENLNRYENEYILAPFTKVSSNTFRSDWNGFKYYDVKLDKPEMRAFEDGEKEKLSQEIKEKFTDVVEKGKRMLAIYDRLELCQERLRVISDKEERKYYSDMQKANYDEMFALSPEISDFEDKMNRYVQGIFEEREREVKEAHDITKQEEERLAKEAYEKRQKELIDESTKQIKEDAPKVISTFQRAPDMLKNTYNSLKNEESRYSQMADILGVPFSLHIPGENIEENLEKLSKNVEDIKTRIDEITGTTFETSKSAMEAVSTLNNYQQKSETVKDNQNVSYNTVKQYSDEATFELKKGVDESVQRTILSTKYKLLQARRREVEGRKISFFGRIRGLGKLKDIELQNIDLEEKILRNTKIQSKSEYSVQDALADMKVFSIRELDGQNTEEMNQLSKRIRRVFGVHDNIIEMRAQEKMRSVPMVMTDIKKRVRTSEKIRRAEQRNSNLQAELADTQNSFGQNPGFGAYRRSEAIQNLERILDDTVKITMTQDDRPENIIENVTSRKNPYDDGYGTK